jgi:hypothetical protein
MTAQGNSELAQFHQFVGQVLSSTPDLTPEEAMDLWRASHPQEDDFEETVLALKEAIAELEAGDIGQPAEEFLREFRAQRGLPN